MGEFFTNFFSIANDFPAFIKEIIDGEISIVCSQATPIVFIIEVLMIGLVLVLLFISYVVMFFGGLTKWKMDR